MTTVYQIAISSFNLFFKVLVKVDAYQGLIYTIAKYIRRQIQ